MRDIFSERTLFDDLLQRIGYKLQISRTQRELAEERYNSVGKWLSQDESFNDGDVSIYPQGSLGIGTTVKPLNQQEYDLDLVCEIEEYWRGKNPLELLNLIENRLKEHKTYAAMVERKNRCIRLNYANEFHMDILPAHPTDQTDSTCIKVPDRKAKDWKDSNPRGYVNWFNEQAKQYETYFEKKAHIDPLPDDESVERKSPLKRAVQLIKRYRDVYFEDDLESAPISIVLTTLAGRAYYGQASVTESISHILNEIDRLIPKEGRLIVLNPSNPDEDLSERWDSNPDLYEKFKIFVKEFKQQWNHVTTLQGIHNIAAALKEMFGENIINESIKDQVEFIEKARKSQKLSVMGSTGMLVAASKETTSIPVRKNTFYGE
jgi:hypothetical protein